MICMEDSTSRTFCTQNQGCYEGQVCTAFPPKPSQPFLQQGFYLSNTAPQKEIWHFSMSGMGTGRQQFVGALKKHRMKIVAPEDPWKQNVFSSVLTTRSRVKMREFSLVVMAQKGMVIRKLTAWKHSINFLNGDICAHLGNFTREAIFYFLAWN